MAGRFGLGDASGARPPEPDRGLADLGLSPLALALLWRPGSDPESRLHKVVALQAGRDTAETRLALDADAAATLWAAGRAFHLIAEARPLRPADLGDGDDGIAVALEANELSADLAVARQALQTLRDTITDAIEDPGIVLPDPPVPREPLRPPFEPRPPRPNTPAPDALLMRDLIAMDLAGPGDSKLEQARDRIDKRLAAANEAPDEAAALDALMGELPGLVPLRQTNIAYWEGGKQLQGKDDLPGWIETSAHVRGRLQPLADLLLSAGDSGQVMQWPMPVTPSVAAPVDFIGAPLQEDDVYHARSAMIAFGAPVMPGQSLGGLHLDAWEETLPDRQSTAGLVAEAETPPARAPNAVLLAPPPEGRPWRAPDLVATIDAAMDMARLRTLCLTDLPRPEDPGPGGGQTGAVYGDLGQILPLTGFPHEGLDVLRALCDKLLEPDR